MGGSIWVESLLNRGSRFVFEVKLEHSDKPRGAIIFGNIRPSDIKLLIADRDAETRAYFKSITGSFGICRVDEAENINQTLDLAISAKEAHEPYDVIFVDYSLSDEKTVELVHNSRASLDMSHVIAITTFLNWNKIADRFQKIGITRFIPKPIFPSSVLNLINEIIGKSAKGFDIVSQKLISTPDFSDIKLLLAEDIEINREVFLALLEDTGALIDIADNGVAAVEKFTRNPEKYDIIIMDVQMPEMDGYEATASIRSLNCPRAKTIPIIAMTANVFKEDIDKCIKSGMNDHIAKPIDESTVTKKILQYCRKPATP